MIDPALERRWQVLNEQRPFGRVHPATLRAAWWAFRAVRRARRDLARDGVTVIVDAPPQVPWGGRTGVMGVLNRTSPTCLERCVVHQRWLGAHGIETEIVIGVLREGSGEVKAHAWIEELTDPAEYAEFRVIHRMPSG